MTHICFYLQPNSRASADVILLLGEDELEVKLMPMHGSSEGKLLLSEKDPLCCTRDDDQ